MTGNGLGPWWFPPYLRKKLTQLGNLFFQEAAWEIHDESYRTKNPSRWRADKGFLAAMMRDASETEGILKMFACTILSWSFWSFVRVFGWMSYGKDIE